MNYKKMGIIGALCAMGALAPQKTNADIIYVVEEPVYTTPVVQPVYTTTYTTPVVQPVYTTAVGYNTAYYDGYYDAMNRRWWYNNCWTYRRPPVCRTPRYNYCAPAYRPRINRCAPAPRFNHCAPAYRPRINRCAPAPRFNHCAPRGGFHHGGPRGGRCR